MFEKEVDCNLEHRGTWTRCVPFNLFRLSIQIKQNAMQGLVSMVGFFSRATFIQGSSPEGDTDVDRKKGERRKGRGIENRIRSFRAAKILSSVLDAAAVHHNSWSTDKSGCVTLLTAWLAAGSWFSGWMGMVLSMGIGVLISNFKHAATSAIWFLIFSGYFLHEYDNKYNEGLKCKRREGWTDQQRGRTRSGHTKRKTQINSFVPERI